MPASTIFSLANPWVAAASRGASAAAMQRFTQSPRRTKRLAAAAVATRALAGVWG